MIYLFNNNEEMIRIIPNSAIKRLYQTQTLTDENYISDRLDVEIQALNDEELSELEYMAIDDIENPQRFHYYFIVKETTEHQITSLTGVQSGIEELRKTPIYDIRPDNRSPKFIADRLLEGTNWQAGYTTDDVGTLSTTFYYTDVFSALKKMCLAFGIEMQFFVEITANRVGARYIEFRKRTGKSVGKRVVYGHNALKIVKEVEKTNTVTALIGRGKGVQVSESDEGNIGYGRKIGFEDVEWKKSSGAPVDKPLGQEFVEIPELTMQYGIKNSNGTVRPKIGFVEFQDEESETQLINRTYDALLELSRPQVLLETSSVYLPNTGIGDTINVVRHDRDLRYQTRVFEITWDRLANKAVDMKLGDRLGESENKRISRISNQVSGNISTELGPTIDELVDHLTTADGKNTNWYTNYDPMENPDTKGLVRVNDNWWQPDPEFEGEFILKQWNGEMWVEILRTSGNPELVRRFEEIESQAEELSKDIEASDQKANEALEKAGANASLLTTHQSTLNTINTVTLPDIASSAGTALANAKDAMDEAKKADGKIADYVTTNGLVSGTVVDSKIDDATGEISRTIRTVESKIPTEIGARNYVINSNFASEFSNWHVNNSSYVSLNDKVVKSSGFAGAGIFATINNTSEAETYTISVYIKGTGSIRIGFESNVRIIPVPNKDNFTRINFTTVRGASSTFILYTNTVATSLEFKNIQIEKGTILTDWKLAPEDNYTQEEFKIFESTYNEDVKGIRSSLSSLSNDKLDGSTYTTFYKNEYEKTAEGLKDAYTKIGKVIDEDGNTTDTFAKAVYDQNTTRRTEDFDEVTKDLVKEATYTAGINGLSGSISTLSGRLDKLTVGGRNYALKSNVYYYTTDYKVSEYDLSKIPKGTKIKISVWGGLSSNVRTFGAYINNENGTTSGNSQIIELTKLDGVFGQGVSSPLAKWTGEATLNVDASKILIFGLDNNNTAPKRIEYVKVETGETFTDWTIAPEDMLGKADFQVFKTTYEANDKLIKARLLAVDSGEEGSIAYRLNETEKTASGNTTTISNIKTKPGEQITGYQTIKERSELYERVIGKDEAGIKSNMARMVMTDSLFKQEVIGLVPSAIGGRNYVLKSNDYYYTNNYKVAEYDLSMIPKNTKIKISIWGGLGTSVRTFGVYINNSIGTTSGNSQIIELTKLDGVFGQGLSVPLAKWTAEATLNVDAKKILIYGLDNNHTAPKRVEYVQIETGDYFTDWTAAPEDKASQSQVTQLANSWSMALKSGDDVKTSINATTSGIRLKGSVLHLDGDTLMNNAFARNLVVDNLLAGDVTAFTAKFSSVIASNLDVNNLTGNKATFLQSAWPALNSRAVIDGTRIRLESGTQGAFVEMNNIPEFRSQFHDGTGVVMAKGRVQFFEPNGGSQGYIGRDIHTGTNDFGIFMSRGKGFRIARATDSSSSTGDKYYTVKSGATWRVAIIEDMVRMGLLPDGDNQQFVANSNKIAKLNGWPILPQDWPTLRPGDQVMYEKGKVVNDGGTGVSYEDILNFGKNGALTEWWLYMRQHVRFEAGYTSASDRRIKHNIQSTDVVALKEIESLNMVQFNMNSDGRYVPLGLIAQESGLLRVPDETNEGINVELATMLSLKGVQELHQRVKELEEEVKILKGNVE